MNRLENIKRSEISYFSDYEWFPAWETCLTSNFWKNWRTKIPSFQTEEDLCFYLQRLGEIASVIWRAKKYGVKEGEDADLLIKKEENRLQNISQEEWKKEYKFSDAEVIEMTAEEINKNFGKELRAIFNGEINQLNKEQLTKEAKKLISLIPELKKTENLDQSQIMNRNMMVQKLEGKLSQIQSLINPTPTSPIALNFFLICLFLLGGLIVYKVKNNKIKK